MEKKNQKFKPNWKKKLIITNSFGIELKNFGSAQFIWNSLVRFKTVWFGFK